MSKSIFTHHAESSGNRYSFSSLWLHLLGHIRRTDGINQQMAICDASWVIVSLFDPFASM
jgi:hypothetical protein